VQTFYIKGGLTMSNNRHRLQLRADEDEVNAARINMLRKYKGENMTKLFRILLNRYNEGKIEITQEEWKEGDKL